MNEVGFGEKYKGRFGEHHADYEGNSKHYMEKNTYHKGNDRITMNKTTISIGARRILEHERGAIAPLRGNKKVQSYH